jgi:threonine dehydrogenase-like Zn-dependent dehydrogenase
MLDRRSSHYRFKPGDAVIMPFAFSDGTCVFCHDGLQTSCVHGGFFGTPEVAGAQAEAVRIPLADGTLFPVQVDKDDALTARDTDVVSEQ